MAVIRPFRALRPRPDRAQLVASVPYDVVNTDEARALAEGNPLSFLHVSRPEIDLPPDTDIHSDTVYRKAVENFEKLTAECPLEKEAEPGGFRNPRHNCLPATCNQIGCGADTRRKLRLLYTKAAGERINCNYRQSRERWQADTICYESVFYGLFWDKQYQPITSIKRNYICPIRDRRAAGIILKYLFFKKRIFVIFGLKNDAKKIS